MYKGGDRLLSALAAGMLLIIRGSYLLTQAVVRACLLVEVFFTARQKRERLH
jgi:hypothetical protein